MATQKLIPRLAALALASIACACSSTDGSSQHAVPAIKQQDLQAQPMRVQYLEVVTTDVDATCKALTKAHNAIFGDPNPGFGGARTAALLGGGQIGVRAPLAEHEQAVVRPYLLVEDIEAALLVATEAGGQIAMPSTEIPGHGRFAIYILGGIQHGLWQN